eukprot:CAMPEP_0179727672 /NCGR_PEP_ID=MMETSP0938-20121108/7738_1 /TAXON_ID=548131 ORGANISM="Ostreococcus mediterraneus, Strain clade-D-RCC1107" /NCGR_SAMPLE_ID=MMETSP0938 /ASSEMBLY_ACC=CAM_ASM_000576 /LENGTH=92 /DNA_ID=CAMNT_0021601899 /DNA_START=151 /DNA_END=429 /DNA_ORIENTATION=+
MTYLPRRSLVGMALDARLRLNWASDVTLMITPASMTLAPIATRTSDGIFVACAISAPTNKPFTTLKATADATVTNAVSPNARVNGYTTARLA